MIIVRSGEGRKMKVPWLAYYYAPAALTSCVLTSLSCNHVASVMGSVKNDNTERLFIGKQVGCTGEVKKGTEE